MQEFGSKEVNSMIKVALEGLEDSKAQNLNIISLENKGLVADALLVVHGTSNVHMQSIAKKLAKNFTKSKIDFKIEGPTSDSWVLVDCGNVIIHIFSKESREFYSLEKLWTIH